MRRAVGTSLDVRGILEGLRRAQGLPNDQLTTEALKACRMLMVEMAQGRLSLMRNPWEGRR